MLIKLDEEYAIKDHDVKGTVVLVQDYTSTRFDKKLKKEVPVTKNQWYGDMEDMITKYIKIKAIEMDPEMYSDYLENVKKVKAELKNTLSGIDISELL